MTEKEYAKIYKRCGGFWGMKIILEDHLGFLNPKSKSVQGILTCLRNNWTQSSLAGTTRAIFKDDGIHFVSYFPSEDKEEKNNIKNDLKRFSFIKLVKQEDDIIGSIFYETSFREFFISNEVIESLGKIVNSHPGSC